MRLPLRFICACLLQKRVAILTCNWRRLRVVSCELPASALLFQDQRQSGGSLAGQIADHHSVFSWRKIRNDELGEVGLSPNATQKLRTRDRRRPGSVQQIGVAHRHGRGGVAWLVIHDGLLDGTKIRGQGGNGVLFQRKDVALRSEERRVGKECRARWSAVS